MSDEEYLYEDTPCRKLPIVYFCKENMILPSVRKPDCIFSLLKLEKEEPQNCDFTKVIIEEEIIEKINDEYYIGVFPKEVKLQAICAKTDILAVKGSYLIQIPTGCRIKTNTYTYYNEKSSTKEQPLILPELKQQTQATKPIQSLKLSQISLDKLHRIQVQQQNMQPISDFVPSSSHAVWSIPITILLTIAIISAVVLYYTKYGSPQRRKKTEKPKEMETFLDEAQVVPPSSFH